MRSIDLTLLFFGWESLAHHVVDFGAIQAHALRASLQRPSDIRKQSGVDPKSRSMPIRRDARRGGQTFQVSREFGFFLRTFSVLLTLGVGGGRDDHPLKAINNNIPAINQRHWQVLDTHDGRDPKCFGQNREMRVNGTAPGHDPFESFPRHGS